MKIAILGYAREGHSAYEYWNSADNQITICDQDTSIALPTGVGSRLGPDYLSGLDEFDLIVRTASLYPGDIVKANSPAILNKVTSSTNEFFRVCPSKNIIGVTGTKGKGTTSTIIARLLSAAGHRAHLGGNIGNPALGLLKDQIKTEDWVVIELSSFQLIDLKHSPHIAVCLMIAPEHLNWHLSIDEYTESKSNIFNHQTESDIAIYFADNHISQELAFKSPARKIPFFASPGALVNNDFVVIDDQAICRTADIKLLGKHNWQNVCAAVTAFWQVDQNPEAALQVIRDFDGLEHRLELVRELDGARYFNDSFASVPDAAIAAIESIAGPKLVILGGFDRGLDLTNLARSIKEHQTEVEKIILIGASADRTANALEQADFANFEITKSKSMAEIVKLVCSMAKPNDSVVLSPGFPSFDMFKNFEERGQQFKEAVNSL